MSNSHETGILRGLIQAFLAVTKGSVSKTATTPAESVLALVVQVATEVLQKIESLEAGSTTAPTTPVVPPVVTPTAAVEHTV